MNAIEVRRYMSQAWRIRIELKAAYASRVELRSMAEKMTASYSLTPGGPHEGSSKVENYALRLVELSDDIAESEGKLIEVLEETKRMISLAPDPLQRAVLTMYHIEGRTAEQTAYEVGYSLRQIWRVMNSAYEEIAKRLS